MLLALDAAPALVVAMFCRTAGAAMLNVTLSLYIMDNIGRRELTRSEPLRLAISTLAWGLAPYVGVRLMEAARALGAGGRSASPPPLVLVALFWALRLAEGGPIRAPARGGRRRRCAIPLAAARRFAAQPRLRLAWAIAFARSAFWTTFFVYVPILMVEGGLDATAGGIAVAAGNLMLLNNLFARRWAERHGLRRVLGASLIAAGALALAAGVLSLAPACGCRGRDGRRRLLHRASSTASARCPSCARSASTSGRRWRRSTAPTSTPRSSCRRSPTSSSSSSAATPRPSPALAALLAVTGGLTLRYLPRGM